MSELKSPESPIGGSPLAGLGGLSDVSRAEHVSQASFGLNMHRVAGNGDSPFSQVPVDLSPGMSSAAKSPHAASFASPFGLKIEEVANENESEHSIVSPISMIDDQIELRHPSPAKDEPVVAEPVAQVEDSAAADDEDTDI